jgi:epoxyqueuosine reductase
MNEMIIEAAGKSGIDLIGFSNLLDYSYLEEVLIKRKSHGYDNELEEGDIEKRLYVRKYFPSCRSIIVCGFPYAEGYKKISTSDKGLLSVVSFREDYHLSVRKKLESFAEKLLEKVSFSYKISVDTSPLIDREISMRAGLGSYGKNSMLINEKYGSFIVLGYLLTDIELGSTSLVENKDICGDCKICIKNCPNGAILEGGVINSKRCISYLTQTKNYIPPEYRKNMRNQIYGCDMCQLACPKNKKILKKETYNDYNELLVDLGEILDISNTEFTKKYSILSGSWRGRNIWKRNAIISIGNLNLTYMYDRLKEELNSQSKMIKSYSAWSLVQLDRKDACDVLNKRMKYEDDDIRREYIKLMEDR